MKFEELKVGDMFNFNPQQDVVYLFKKASETTAIRVKDSAVLEFLADTKIIFIKQ